MSTTNFGDYFIAACIGAVVGIGELVSRYQDEPGRALRTWPAFLYFSINAAASGGALWLIREVGIVSTPKVGEASARWGQVFSAGFGAMVVFRCSLTTARRDSREAGIGPANFLQVILKVVDRAVDRRRGRERNEVIERTMCNISFDKAYVVLTAHCLGLLKNTTEQEQAELGKIVDGIRKRQMPQQAKSRLLGLELLNVVGEKLLALSVQTCRSEISMDKHVIETEPRNTLG